VELFEAGALRGCLAASTQKHHGNREGQARGQHPGTKEPGSENFRNHERIGEHRKRRKEDNRRNNYYDNVHGHPSIPHRKPHRMSQARKTSRLVIRRIRITGWSAITALLVTIVTFLTWFHIVLPADRAAVDAAFADDRIRVSLSDGVITASPANAESTTGMVFYPGAKVDPYAYLPAFRELVADGLTVVIIEPLFNMALFDLTPLQEATATAPTVTDWWVGGHSLGGVKACMVAEEESLQGLVLLASFCANDLSGTDLEVLQVLGDRDDLTDLTAVAEARTLLPSAAKEHVIEGANHASFGAYGPQSGDGQASISKPAGFAALTEALTPVLGAD